MEVVGLLLPVWFLKPGYTGAAWSTDAWLAVWTKPLFLWAILNLAQHGQLALNDKISKWDWALPHIDSNITITHLPDTKSGIYDILTSQALNLEMITHQDVVFSPWDIITRYLLASFLLRVQWSYSNTNHFYWASSLKNKRVRLTINTYDLSFWNPINWLLSRPLKSWGEGNVAGPRRLITEDAHRLL